MTQDDIIRMAQEAGFAEWHGTDDVRFVLVIERFFQLVAAHEREECAKVCEELADQFHAHAADCAAAIRARGNK
jgi:hypothetical protein